MGPPLMSKEETSWLEFHTVFIEAHGVKYGTIVMLAYVVTCIVEYQYVTISHIKNLSKRECWG